MLHSYVDLIPTRTEKDSGGWEFDIPPQSRPADDKVELFASAFLRLTPRPAGGLLAIRCCQKPIFTT